MTFPAEALELGAVETRPRRPWAGPGLAASGATWLALVIPLLSFATTTIWGIRSLSLAWEGGWQAAVAAGRVGQEADLNPEAQIMPAGGEPSAQVLEMTRAGGLPPVFSPPVLFWEANILRWARGFRLDPVLVATVMQIESCGDPLALSGAGAAGLFQVMPYHFAAGEDPFDPDANARRGLAYLAAGLEKASGDIFLALAGYNGGHGVMSRPPEAWAGETQRYAAWGAGIYREASAGQRPSPTLKAWLEAGGRSLCQQAAERLGLKQP